MPLLRRLAVVVHPIIEQDNNLPNPVIAFVEVENLLVLFVQ